MGRSSRLLVKVTATPQITTPAHVLATLCAMPGDDLQREGGTEGYLLRARRVEYARLAPLHAGIRRGRSTFDLNAIGDEPRGTGLRD